MRLPERVEQLLINTEDIDLLIDIVHGNVATPDELSDFNNELDYLMKYDETTIYNLWLDVQEVWSRQSDYKQCIRL